LPAPLADPRLIQLDPDEPDQGQPLCVVIVTSTVEGDAATPVKLAGATV